ncbi:hypothetical protein GPJ56_002808 [Histomonas meleagridis]|uniref:uncharacterized protein n=1 Tax=Histomonas meleagridis TaxID=135588 RepID=UPI00355A7B29|nr:hypothetical protein GPJ56_002808 [Histomonas meleagridis]KAH0806324.1 hypothetical protein GO595_001012 [Histomonas meleagridis]
MKNVNLLSKLKTIGNFSVWTHTGVQDQLFSLDLDGISTSDSEDNSEQKEEVQSVPKVNSNENVQIDAKLIATTNDQQHKEEKQNQSDQIQQINPKQIEIKTEPSPKFSVGGRKQNKPINQQKSKNRNKPNPIKIEVPRSTSEQAMVRNPGNRVTQKFELKVEKPKLDLTSDSSTSKPQMPSIKVERSTSNDFKDKNKKIIISRSSSQEYEELELCPFCSKFSFPFNDLLNHILLSHKLLKTFLGNSDSQSNNKCPKCPQVFESTQELVTHCINSHTKDIFISIRDHILQQPEHIRPEVEKFIEKHFPSINSHFHRTFEISSSDSESGDDTEDDTIVDDEYISFLSSSIKTDGISTRTSQPINLDPTRFAFREDNLASSQESIDKYIEELHEYELFLRSFGMIYFERNSGEFICQVCKKRFETTINLVQHCYTQHRARITPELRSILYFLTTTDITNIPDQKLLQMKELRLNLTLYPIVKQPESPRPLSVLNVPMICTDFFIEALAIKPPESLSHQTPKVFHYPTVLMAKLPAPLPIIFQQSTKLNCTAFGFFDTPIAKGLEIQHMVQATLSSLASKPVYRITFKSLGQCPESFSFLDNLCKKYNFIGMITPKVIDNEYGTYNFKMYLMFTYNTINILSEIENEIKDFVKSVEVWKCRRCKYAYNPKADEPCVGPRAGNLTIQLKNSKHEFDRVMSSYEIEKLTVKELI